MKNKRLCVVVPAYNEASCVGDVIDSVKKVAKKHLLSIDVVVVNDGSTDLTSQNAKTHSAIVIDHILNSGAGGATATGVSYAKQNNYDIAATMDADGQHNAEDVIEGMKRLDKENLDLLIGSRLINSDGMSRVKVLGNKGLSLITYVLFGINSTDSQSGLRIFSRKSLEQLRWKTSGYEFCSEMLWRAKQLNLKVGEYPIAAIYTNYSKSKGQNNWNAVNIIKRLLKRRIAELLG